MGQSVAKPCLIVLCTLDDDRGSQDATPRLVQPPEYGAFKVVHHKDCVILSLIHVLVARVRVHYGHPVFLTHTDNMQRSHQHARFSHFFLGPSSFNPHVWDWSPHQPLSQHIEVSGCQVRYQWVASFCRE